MQKLDHSPVEGCWWWKKERKKERTKAKQKKSTKTFLFLFLSTMIASQTSDISLAGKGKELICAPIHTQTYTHITPHRTGKSDVYNILLNHRCVIENYLGHGWLGKYKYRIYTMVSTLKWCAAVCTSYFASKISSLHGSIIMKTFLSVPSSCYEYWNFK